MDSAWISTYGRSSAGQSVNQIVFIDPTVQDYQRLAAGVTPGTEVYVLNPLQDAIAQITQTLMGHSGISAVHILSHGYAGGVQLGNTRLDASTLNQYSNDLHSWSQALTPGADILLYGCDIAEGDVGQKFLQQLAQITGEDFAASNDLTGSAALGGNWTLEVHTGEIAAGLVFNATAIAGYQYILPVDPVSIQGTTFPTNIDANWSGSYAGNYNATDTWARDAMNTAQQSMSADGRYIVFTSDASSLAGVSDGNYTTDVFLRDRLTGTTTLISHNVSNTGTGSGASYNPVISADGNYVAFLSSADNLVNGDYGNTDAFLWERATGNLTWLSRSTSGGNSTGNANYVSISDDGSRVSFVDNGNNLTSDTSSYSSQVYVWDRNLASTNKLVKASVNNSGQEANDPTNALAAEYAPLISGNGRYVVFYSYASNLMSGSDNNASDSGGRDIFVRDLQTNTTTLVSAIASDPNSSGNARAIRPTISNDGRYVAFVSFATDLVAGGSASGVRAAFVRDLQTNTTTLVSIGVNGQPIGAWSDFAVISGDGKSVAFTDGTNIYIRHLDTNTTELANVNSAGTVSNQPAVQANGDTPPILSYNGRYVAFTTTATNLDSNDTNSTEDVYVRDLVSQTTTLVSTGQSGIGNDNSYSPVISRDGSVIVFTSAATNFAAGDSNGKPDVFVYTTNQSPIANNDSFGGNEDTLITGSVTLNDTDPDNNVPLAATVISQPTHGSLSLNSNGSFSYTPTLNYNGSDTFTYIARDSLNAASNTATVVLNITAVNDAPVAVNDSYTVSNTATLTVPTSGVLGNDTDVDSPSLTAATVTPTANGTLTFNSNGAFTYTPNTGFSGTDSFTYRANDGSLSSNLATVNIVVTSVAVNQSPVANNDSFGTNEDTALSSTVVSNDSDPDGNTPLTVSLVGGPTHGSLNLNPDGTFSYTPTLNYNGSDTFTYIAKDSLGATSGLATVALNITAVNDAPVAVNDSYTVSNTATLTVPTSGVLGNDTDVDSPSLTAATVTPTANGTLTFNSNGAFTYTPNTGFSGTDSFTYRANDGSLSSNLATVNIVVTSVAVNQSPVANNDSFGTNEDTALSATVVSNDSDPDGNTPLTVSLVGGPTHGSLNLNPDGTFSYTPTLNYNGSDTFTYIAKDSLGATSGLATVALNITAVNDAPVAVNDSYTVSNTATLTVPTSGVLGNDTDVDSPSLTAATVTPTANGTLTFNSNGAFTYTPNTGFSGTDSFTYRANDGSLSSNLATVNIVVTSVAVNQSPVANNDSFGTNEDTALSATVVSNDSDPDGNTPLTVSLVGGPTHGSLNLNPDGTFSYTPTLNYNGSDTFTYIAKDSLGATSGLATVALNITAVNDAPVAVNDSFSGNEDTVITGNVTANDTDVENNTPFTVSLIANPTHGSLNLNPDGTFSYTPTLNYNGSDTFTYIAKDSLGATSGLATVALNITAVNDAPVAVNDSYTVSNTATLTVPTSGVLGNDTDVDSPSLTAATVTPTANGTLTFNSNGAFTYTPNTGFSGTDSFTYRANDGSLSSNLATVNIVVTSVAVNQSPVANNDSFGTNEDTALSATVVSNDSDPDGNTPLTVSLVGGPTHGSLNLNPDGTFSYTPTLNYNGSDTFTYIAKDSLGATSGLATVALNITAVNDAPVAVNDSYTVSNTATLTVPTSGVLGNDTDVDSPSLTAATVTPTANGTLTFNSNGAFTYTPNTGFSGTDSFTYRANDGSLSSNLATVNIVVTSVAVNQSPVANNDSFGTNEDTALSATVVSNDSDPDGNTPLTVSLVGGPTHGSLNLNPDGTFSYTPTLNYNGSDTFTYIAKDSLGATSGLATVALNITAVNDAPVAVNDSFSGNEDTVITGNVTANDTDVENNTPFTVSLIANPTHGSLNLNPDGTFSYTPTLNYNGSDTFTYIAKDSLGATSGLATVALNITAVNDAPVAVNDSYTVSNTATLTVPTSGVLGNDTDVDSPSLTAATVTPTANGSLTFNSNGAFMYTPNTGFSGTDSFTYRASDGSLSSNLATVNIVVTSVAVNQSPVANNDSFGTNEDTALSATVVSNDSDPDGNTPLTVSVVNGTTSGSLSLNPNGGFSYTPNANFNGVDTFTYVATDSLGATSGLATVTLSVASVNDAPGFTAGANQSAIAGSGAQTVNLWATGFNPGPSDEAGQTVAAYLVSNSNPGIFAAAPTINSAGTLVYTPVSSLASAQTATVSVQVQDSGGTANGGINTSPVQVFTITVTPQPTLSVNSISQAEGNSGTTAYNFTVSLSSAGTQTVTVQYATADGTATIADNDYTATTGTLVFAPGETTKVVTVSAIADNKYESNETFQFNLTAPSQATIATGTGTATLVNDDSQPFISVNSVTKAEGNSGTTPLVFTISLSGTSSQTVSVSYATADGTAATADNDYIATAGTLVFAPGELTKTVTVTGIGDANIEQTETFSLQLTSPVNASILSNTGGTGTILNDDHVTYSDFNHDGQEDIVWRNYQTGETMVWLMNGTLRVGTVALPTVSIDWVIEGVGDFNHDGNPDLVWRNYQTGQTGIWLMNGTTFVEAVSLATVDTSWKIQGVGDFNGDGNVDLVWRNYQTGQNGIWLMNNTNQVGIVSLATVSTNWSIEGVGDYNGDGHPDIIWRDYQTGNCGVWETYGGGSNVFYNAVSLFNQPDPNWHIGKVGDLNSDGSLDYVWRNYSTGQNGIWLMNGSNLSGIVPLDSLDVSWQMV